MTQLTCTALTNDGKPCPAPRQTDALFCLWHDPARVEAAQLARSKGGINRRQLDNSEYPGDVKNADQLLAVLNSALSDAWQLEGNIQRLHVITGLLRVCVEILSLTSISAKLELLQGLLYAPNKSSRQNS